MECKNCFSEELKEEIIKTTYRYNAYFEDYLKEDLVQFKCKKCGFVWLEII